MNIYDATSVGKLSKIDSLYYFGNKVIHSAIEQASITKKEKILDIGSGLGGSCTFIESFDKMPCRCDGITRGFITNCC